MVTGFPFTLIWLLVLIDTPTPGSSALDSDRGNLKNVEPERDPNSDCHFCFEQISYIHSHQNINYICKIFGESLLIHKNLFFDFLKQ